MSVDILKALFESLSPEEKQEILSQLLDKNPLEDIPAHPKAVIDKPKTRGSAVNEDFSVTPPGDQRGHRTPVKAKSNQWTDEGENRDENFDPTKYEKVARSRPAPDVVEVECHVCKKSFIAHGSTLFGSFPRCGRCIGS